MFLQLETVFEREGAALPAVYAGGNGARAGRRRRVLFEGAAARGASFGLLLVMVLAFSSLIAFRAASGMAGGAAELIKSASGYGETSGGAENSAPPEGLGRLKLITMPGLISVFAPSNAPVLPFAPEASAVEDDLTARLYAPAGTQVFCMLAGSVRATAPGVVIVSCADGIEITYMGVADIAVERGQPVMQRTVLGVLERDVLYLRITRDGRPIDPVEFLGAGARVG